MDYLLLLDVTPPAQLNPTVNRKSTAGSDAFANMVTPLVRRTKRDPPMCDEKPNSRPTSCLRDPSSGGWSPVDPTIVRWSTLGWKRAIWGTHFSLALLCLLGGAMHEHGARYVRMCHTLESSLS